jgi:hypothetical protein
VWQRTEDSHEKHKNTRKIFCNFEFPLGRGVLSEACTAMSVVPPHPQPFSPAKPGEKGAGISVSGEEGKRVSARWQTLARCDGLIGRPEQYSFS